MPSLPHFLHLHGPPTIPFTDRRNRLLAETATTTGGAVNSISSRINRVLATDLGAENFECIVLSYISSEIDMDVDTAGSAGSCLHHHYILDTRRQQESSRHLGDERDERAAMAYRERRSAYRGGTWRIGGTGEEELEGGYGVGASGGE
jgi:hypothetical protein